MAKYELTLVFRPSLTGEAVDAIIEKLKIAEEKRKSWGKRLLSYPLKKEKEGNYIFFETDLKEAEANELKKRLEINDNIIRYLLIRV